tara:strand:+ start:509 stop:967 length:459 start_codon:yes stop_codon:yes gene_type:complete
MDKYYIPESSELRVGFEIEYLRNGTWHEDTVNDLYYAYDTWKDHEAGRHSIRVKYLDQEDIESLGFEYEKTMSLGSLRASYWTGDNSIVGRILTKENSRMTCWNMAIHVFKDHHVKIECKMADAEVHTFFEGIIKNKSELKTVLKMIGYEKV